MRGNYPRGKIRDDDEGATLLQMGIKNGVVIMDFGKNLRWIGLHKEQALEISNMLLSLSKQLEENLQ